VSFSVEKEKGQRRDFNGHWSGFDDDNNKIGSGTYVFKYRPRKLRIRSWNAAGDKEAVLNLSQQNFGQTYFEASVQPRLQKPKGHGRMPKSHVLVAESKRDPALGFETKFHGFCACYMLPASALANFLGKPDLKGISDSLQQADRNGTVGVVQTICVAEGLRRRGIGRDLLRKAEQYLSCYNPTVVMAPAWRVKDKVNAEELLSSSNFKESHQFPDFWKGQCEANSFVCPKKPAGGACGCSMSLFVKGPLGARSNELWRSRSLTTRWLIMKNRVIPLLLQKLPTP